jgi:hypothetical protein
MHSEAFLHEPQVAIILAEKELGSGWILKMNPGNRGVLNLGFQTCLFSDSPWEKLALLRIFVEDQWIPLPK